MSQSGETRRCEKCPISIDFPDSPSLTCVIVTAFVDVCLSRRSAVPGNVNPRARPQLIQALQTLPRDWACIIDHLAEEST